MTVQLILIVTILILFTCSALYRFSGLTDLGEVAGRPGSLVTLNFDFRNHGFVMLSSLVFALLLIGKVGSDVDYLLASGLILFIVGMFDNLLGLLPLRKQHRAEIFGGLTHMFLSAVFVAHLGNLLGTAAYVIPIWIAVPLALFSVLSIMKVINLLERTNGKI